MTLGNAAAARVRLIVWCKDCQHQVEPDPAEMAQRYGAETPCPIGASGWSAPKGGSSRRVDMVARVKCTRSPLLQPLIMSPQTVHCSSLVVAPTEGGLVVPNASHALPSTPVTREWAEGSFR
jgi:hypothetical protein